MNHFHHLDVELREEILALRQDMDRCFETVTGEIRSSVVGLILLLGKIIENS